MDPPITYKKTTNTIYFHSATQLIARNSNMKSQIILCFLALATLIFASTPLRPSHHREKKLPTTTVASRRRVCRFPLLRLGCFTRIFRTLPKLPTPSKKPLVLSHVRKERSFAEAKEEGPINDAPQPPLDFFELIAELATYEEPKLDNNTCCILKQILPILILTSEDPIALLAEVMAEMELPSAFHQAEPHLPTETHLPTEPHLQMEPSLNTQLTEVQVQGEAHHRQQRDIDQLWPMILLANGSPRPQYFLKNLRG